jgi:hypothetical protein
MSGSKWHNGGKIDAPYSEQFVVKKGEHIISSHQLHHKFDSASVTVTKTSVAINEAVSGIAGIGPVWKTVEETSDYIVVEDYTADARVSIFDDPQVVLDDMEEAETLDNTGAAYKAIYMRYTGKNNSYVLYRIHHENLKFTKLELVPSPNYSENKVMPVYDDIEEAIL